ncbi:MAG TPA: SDR family oxidoreductase [Myxococcota bacterium]|nr:SDR family oxidoreductase [Myxococcota bacterium]
MASNAVRFDFAGARVLVTGGSNGIGLAIARAFQAAGAGVTITGTRAQASDYRHGLTGFAYVKLDVRDAAAIARVAASLGALDVLVNNAGANFPFQPSEWDPDVFEDSVRVNLFSAFRMSLACKALLSASALHGGASIINLASMASFRAVPIVPGYGSAKAGIVALTRNLAVQWAKENVRVNAIAPGLTDSNMTTPMKAFPEIEAAELAKIPMGRRGVPDEIAPAVLFLASAQASYVTGATLAVCGGFAAS